MPSWSAKGRCREDASYWSERCSSFRMPEMYCAQSRSYLEWYADSELDPVTSARLEKHLDQCVQCRRAAEYLIRLHSRMKRNTPMTDCMRMRWLQSARCAWRSSPASQ